MGEIRGIGPRARIRWPKIEWRKKLGEEKFEKSSRSTRNA